MNSIILWWQMNEFGYEIIDQHKLNQIFLPKQVFILSLCLFLLSLIYMVEKSKPSNWNWPYFCFDILSQNSKEISNHIFGCNYLTFICLYQRNAKSIIQFSENRLLFTDKSGFNILKICQKLMNINHFLFRKQWQIQIAVLNQKSIYNRVQCNSSINNININKVMRHQKTEEDQKQSVSTKVAVPTKAASFSIPNKRQMFLQQTQAKYIQKNYHNILALQPSFSTYAISSTIHFLGSSDQYVFINDAHYAIITDRNKPQMVLRTIQPNSQLLFSNAKRPGTTIIFESVHKYWNKDYQRNMLHINITRYSSQQAKKQPKNVYLSIPKGDHEQESKLVSFTSLQNSKRGLLLFEKGYNSDDNTTSYEFVFLSLMKQNKSKNPYYLHNKTAVKKFGEYSSDEEGEEKKKSKEIYKQYLIEQTISIHKCFVLNNSEEIFIKVANSQFGDALLFITDKEIYNIEIEDQNIELKGVKLSEQIKFAAENSNEIKQRFTANNSLDLIQSDKNFKLVDANYIVNGLKIVFITKSNLIGFLSAQKVKSLQTIKEIVEKKQKCGSFVYEINFNIKRMQTTAFKVVIETQNNEAIILKQNIENQLSTCLLSLQKVLDLPVKSMDSDQQIISHSLYALSANQELILTRIISNIHLKTMKLELSKKNLMSIGHDFSPMHTIGYKPLSYHQGSNYSLNTSQNSTKLLSHQISTNTVFPSSSTDQQRIPKISLANGFACSLHNHEAVFLRIYEGFTTEMNHIEELFSMSFFEKPLQISMDPYGSIVVILFKQFVKLFKFQYQTLQLYYTYNVRNVGYAGFSQSGEYLMIVTEDWLHFLNPYTYITEKCVEAYGQVKNIKYYDTSLFIVLKNKVSKNSLQTYIHWYLESEGKYQKIQEIKIQPEEVYYTDRKFLILVSKSAIKVYYLNYDQLEYVEKTNQDKILQIKPKMLVKSIKLLENSQNPSCITLSEQFGFLLVGTTYGRVYQYLWPLNIDSETENLTDYHFTQIHNSDIDLIRVGTCLEKIYTFSKSQQITELQVNQYINGEQMTTPYIISQKTLYTPELKFRFGNRQYLYQKYTSYIGRYQSQTNETIEELKFICEKIHDDIQQQAIKESQKLNKDISLIQKHKIKDLQEIDEDLQEHKQDWNIKQDQLKNNFEQTILLDQQIIKKQVQQYQKTILTFYKEADRLRTIFSQQKLLFTKQKDLYEITNQKNKLQLVEECNEQEEKFIQKFKGIQITADSYDKFVIIENQQNELELQQYKKYMHLTIEEEFQYEQRNKEVLLGSIQNFIKQISNYKQRRDQFEGLMMETNLQIEQLGQDRVLYVDKKQYLDKELGQKQDMIQQKEKQLISFVKNTENMVKIKNTHQFELKQYEKQFQPINQKLVSIDQRIKSMNEQILTQFNSKQQCETAIKQNLQNQYQLKRTRQAKVLRKHQTKTKVSRLLSQLALLIQGDPLDVSLRRKLNDIVNGETYEINEQQIEEKAKNSKLMRKKEFIKKQIEEQDKKQQQIVRNKNLYFHYYNDNTSLVRYHNQLKQQEQKLQNKKQILSNRIDEVRAKLQKEGNKPQLRRNQSEKSYSMYSKKQSEKLMTPYQRYEQGQLNLMYAKGDTQETKMKSLRKQENESGSLLKTLIKDFEGSNSSYEKMQIVRDRVRSFVNPQIRTRFNNNSRKNMASMQLQKVLFESRKLE